MARIVAVLLTAAALLAAGRLSHAAPSTAEAFWRAVLPSSAVPDTVLRLFRADTSFVSKGNTDGAGRLSDLNYQDYMRSSHTTGKPAPSGHDAPYNYDYKSPSTSAPYNYDYKSPSTSAPYNYGYKAPSGSAARRGGAATTTTTVFFHEEAVRVGERLPFHFPAAAPAALGFLPRHVADSIPFSTPALPGVLALFGVPPGSAQATAMEETLRTCEPPPPEIDGEAMFCATSLEALVERAMAALGTRGVTAVTSTLPRAGAPLQPYTVRAVRRVAGASFVACHDEAYPYTVYRCHSTGPARAYMLEMEGARGGAVTVATVCHTDTSRWNPEHVSFKLLDTKPGGAPICHLMPYGHIIWAKNEKRSPA